MTPPTVPSLMQLAADTAARARRADRHSQRTAVPRRTSVLADRGNRSRLELAYRASGFDAATEELVRLIADVARHRARTVAEHRSVRLWASYVYENDTAQLAALAEAGALGEYLSPELKAHRLELARLALANYAPTPQASDVEPELVLSLEELEASDRYREELSA